MPLHTYQPSFPLEESAKKEEGESWWKRLWNRICLLFPEKFANPFTWTFPFIDFGVFHDVLRSADGLICCGIFNLFESWIGFVWECFWGSVEDCAHCGVACINCCGECGDMDF